MSNFCRGKTQASREYIKDIIQCLTRMSTLFFNHDDEILLNALW